MKIEEIENVFIHEKVMERETKKLIRDLSRAKYIWNPVPVAPINELGVKKWVILDGMHRKAALSNMGCKYIPTFHTDYRDMKIGRRNYKVKLKSWYRVLGGRNVEVEEIIESIRNRFQVEKISAETALRSLDLRNTISVLVVSKQSLEYFLITDPVLKEMKKDEKILFINHRIGEIELKLEREMGFTYEPRPWKKINLEKWIDFDLEEKALEKLKGKPYNEAAVLMVPKVKPEEVKEVAKKGCNVSEKVFIRKTTRHEIPLRPFNVNVPIKALMSGWKTLEQRNEELKEKLIQKNLWIWDDGVILDREYKEPISIFGPKKEKGWIKSVAKLTGKKFYRVKDNCYLFIQAN